MQKGLQYKAMTGAWSLVCLEVYLKCCRDVAAIMFAAMGDEDYDPDKRFGMKIEKGIMTFYFHISLIQDILTEDFKR